MLLDKLLYQILDHEDGIYTGQLVKYPQVISEGKSIDELEANLLDALKETLRLAVHEMDDPRVEKPFTPELLQA